MSQPITVRLSNKELKVLKKISRTKTKSEAIRKLLMDELERQNQIELWEKIYGKMKPSDFDDRLI